jgi:hypothetical protein
MKEPWRNLQSTIPTMSEDDAKEMAELDAQKKAINDEAAAKTAPIDEKLMKIKGKYLPPNSDTIMAFGNQPKKPK